MELFKCTRCGCDTPNKEDFFDNQGKLLFTAHRCDACDKRFDLENEFQFEGWTLLERELICPWCQATYDSYDAFGFEDDEDEVKCMFCGKHFDLEIETSRRYSTKRSLCEMPENYGSELEGGDSLKPK